MSSLPRGLAEAATAVAGLPDGRDRLLTLACLRQLFDPEMPSIAGHDPRAMMSVRFSEWRGCVVEQQHHALLLDLLVARLNQLLGQQLLSGGWPALPPHTVRSALIGISDWRPSPTCGGDVLGEMLQLLRPPGGGRGLGAIYTPYHVCLLMAEINPPKPGEPVYDPCCGSGRILVAAVEACRRRYGPHSVPGIYGCDLDPEAVKVATLNLMLAGVPPTSALVVRSDAYGEEDTTEPAHLR